jgi:uncharacterized membrane protein
MMMSNKLMLELVLYLIYFVGLGLNVTFIYNDLMNLGTKVYMTKTVFYTIYVLHLVLIVGLAYMIYGYEAKNRNALMLVVAGLVGQLAFVSYYAYSKQTMTINNIYFIFAALWAVTLLFMISNTQQCCWNCTRKVGGSPRSRRSTPRK